jgi:hypothetical protein
MGGDPESEQSHEAPARPDTADTEQAEQRQDSRDESQAGDQSNETWVSSHQQKKRGRILGRLRRRRGADSVEQAAASTQQAPKKSKIGLVGILITALVGFFFGIGSNQVTDYIKRADDCADALGQYIVGLNSNFIFLSRTVHDQPWLKTGDMAQFSSTIILSLCRISKSWRSVLYVVVQHI